MHEMLRQPGGSSYTNSHFNAELPYGPQNVPDGLEQRRFFEYAAWSGRLAAGPRRILTGPHRELFLEATRQTQAELNEAVGADIDGSYLHGEYYASPKVRSWRQQHQYAGCVPFEKLILDNRRRLADVGERIHTAGMVTQIIEPGMLSRPRLAYMKEDTFYDHEETYRTCLNTCFRMVFGAITGWVPSELALARAMQRFSDGSFHARQNDYLDILRSPLFNNRVRVSPFTGADLTFIGGLAARVRQRRPEANVYTIVHTDSLVVYRPNAWHSFVLLGANERSVRLQDPQPFTEPRVTELPKLRFSRVWGVGLNSGCLAIDMAPRVQGRPPDA